jgi:hypothetical protein
MNIRTLTGIAAVATGLCLFSGTPSKATSLPSVFHATAAPIVALPEQTATAYPWDQHDRWRHSGKRWHGRYYHRYYRSGVAYTYPGPAVVGPYYGNRWWHNNRWYYHRRWQGGIWIYF